MKVVDHTGQSWDVRRAIVHTETVKGWSASRERIMELAEAARLALPSGSFNPGASPTA